MRVTQQHGAWRLDIETVPVEGMFTAKATISRKRTDGQPGMLGYTFKDVGVMGSPQEAADWAADWLRGWLDDNA
ncbi:hypothetical protein [Burkholderia sp. BDU5]|uniref:hypothetical protein n=1 Tax=Burkholderia sp. BDU5 TaxID=1385590 RepID=UPI000751FA7B|nr:hypothetical protein [Burkholderia sp. BDU5]KVE35714.1 hypothetical protein WS69_13770 [Burkholderia sp. BDU5]